MPVHLQDLMGQQPWLLWLIIAPLFVGAEVLQRRRVWVLWAPAAVLAALTAAIVPAWWPLQAAVFAVTGIVLLVVLRPRLRGPASRDVAAKGRADDADPAAVQPGR